MNYLGPDIAARFPEDANVIILPVPYEESTSYGKGTKNGPQAIITASPNLEFYDEVLDAEPWRTGVYTEPAIDCNRDRNYIFENTTRRVNEFVRQGKLVITLGGEHSISYPAYQGVHDQFDNLSVLQLDAHSDLRDSYNGSPYSHACVMRRIWEVNKNITGVGIRSQSVEERSFIKESNIDIVYAHNVRAKGWPDKILDRILPNVYLTFDVDFFDPSVIPATGTPEPGGFLWYETLDFLKRVFDRKNVVAIDVVELSPNKNHIHADFTIARLIYKMIGFYCTGRKASDEKS